MRYTFLQFPILGEASVRAAVATECAAEQERFWEYHDALFEASRREGSTVFTSDGLVGVARKLGLDVNRFSSCLSEQRTLSLVQADAQAARALGLRGTPTVFINDVAYPGLATFEVYKARIEEALSKR